MLRHEPSLLPSDLYHRGLAGGASEKIS